MIEEINDWEELRQYFEDAIYDTYNSIRNYHEVIFMEETFGAWDWPDLVPGK